VSRISNRKIGRPKGKKPSEKRKMGKYFAGEILNSTGEGFGK